MDDTESVTPEQPKRESLRAKTVFGIACLVGAGIVGVLAMFPALVALAPLAVAIVPVAFLVWWSHRRRQIAQGRNIDEANEGAFESNDWYKRERQRRGGHIIDDRVDHLL